MECCRIPRCVHLEDRASGGLVAERRPIGVAVATLEQGSRRLRIVGVAKAEVMDRLLDGPGDLHKRDLERRAEAVRAAPHCCSVEGAVAHLDQRRIGKVSIGLPQKGIEACEAARRRDPEHRAETIRESGLGRAAKQRRPVEVAVASLDQRG